MGQFKAQSGVTYYNPSGQSVKYTSDQIKGPAQGWLSDDWSKTQSSGQDDASGEKVPRQPSTTGAGEDFDMNAFMKEKTDSRLNENDAYEQERLRIQGLIDLINVDKQRELDKIAEKETGQLGQQRGMSSRRGLAGSGFGSAQKQNITSLAAEEKRLANSAATAKIAQLTSDADSRALERIQAEQARVDQAGTEYMDFLNNQKTEARSDMADLASSGVDLDTLDDDFYSKLIDQSGYTPGAFEIMWEANKPKASQIEYDNYWRGDNLVMVGQDPVTGEMVNKTYTAEDLGIPAEDKPVNPKFQTDKASGNIYWYDQDNPQTDEEGNLVMKPLQIPGKDRAFVDVMPKTTSTTKSTMDYKLDFAKDKSTNNMTKEEALSVYGPVLGAEWVYNQYGEKAPFKITQAESESKSETDEEAENDSYWENKLKGDSDKYYRKGNDVYEKIGGKGGILWKADKKVYTFIY